MEAERLLLARLAPDMSPLSTQVRFACVQAWEAVCCLTGEEFPPSINVLLVEGRNASEYPGNIIDAQARIKQAIAMLDRLAPDALDSDAERIISHTYQRG